MCGCVNVWMGECVDGGESVRMWMCECVDVEQKERENKRRERTRSEVQRPPREWARMRMEEAVDLDTISSHTYIVCFDGFSLPSIGLACSRFHTNNNNNKTKKRSGKRRHRGKVGDQKENKMKKSEEKEVTL